MKTEYRIGMMRGSTHYVFTVFAPKDVTIEKINQQISQAMVKPINPDWDGTPETAVKFACKRNNWEYGESVSLVVPEGFF
jgi:hypothetical protein